MSDPPQADALAGAVRALTPTEETLAEDTRQSLLDTVALYQARDGRPVHHWRDGWTFVRLADGAVSVWNERRRSQRLTIPAEEWASIVREMTAPSVRGAHLCHEATCVPSGPNSHGCHDPQCESASRPSSPRPEIEKLDELAQKLTPGPWARCQFHTDEIITAGACDADCRRAGHADRGELIADCAKSDADAAFIVALVNAWPQIRAALGAAPAATTAARPDADEAFHQAQQSYVELRAQYTALEAERNEYRTLSGIGKWHADCRPNRHMAAREIAKSQEIINRLADRISALEAENATLKSPSPSA